jgi:type IV secretion system T-DNA border endonuclease VirD2
MTDPYIVTPTPASTSAHSQAFIRIVPRGGAKSATQIYNQLMYLSRRGAEPLRRCARHLSIALTKSALKAAAQSWVSEAGVYQSPQDAACAVQALTTHIVISFPPGTDVSSAFTAGRAWAEEMFGSGRHGGTFDYLTACHNDRPHPHVHLLLNRRALEGHWLKISRRHPDLNYERLRSSMVAIARLHGIALEASSRVTRGIDAPAVTYAEYRRRARRSAARDDASRATPQASKS